MTVHYGPGATHRPIALAYKQMNLAGSTVSNETWILCACGATVHVNDDHAAEDFWKKHGIRNTDGHPSFQGLSIEPF